MPTPSRDITLWLDPAQAPWALQAVRAARLNVIGVGCPRPTAAAEIAPLFAGPDGPAPPATDDLRAALAQAQPGIFWILWRGEFGQQDPGAIADLLHACDQRSVRVASIEPLPGALLGLVESGDLAGRNAAPLLAPAVGISADQPPSAAFAKPWCPVLPLTRFTKAGRDLLGVLEPLGPVRAAMVQSLGPPEAGTLSARLFDAMDLLSMIMGEPEVIDAAYGAPLARGIHAQPGEGLTNLHGDLSANVRFGGGRAAAVLCSDQSARYETSLVLLGPGGRVRLSDDGFEWIDASGNRIDRSGSGGKPKRARRTPGPSAGTEPADPPSPATASLATLAAEQLTRLVELGPAATDGVNAARVLAMAQAALLSARTGEGESPATMLRMAGV